MSDNYISGIYDYCDRWCERCAFTARCFLFAREDKFFGDKTEHDLKSGAFWKTMHDIFSDTKELIQRAAEEHGIDLNAVDQDELAQEMKAIDKIHRHVLQDPLVVQATGYLKLVNKWFEQHASSFEQKQDDLASLDLMQINGCDPEAEAISITDACEGCGIS
jgi:hypothetical protein